MDKTIEIKLPEILYEKLENQCKDRNITLEHYIIELLMEKEYTKTQVQQLKKIITIDLQKLIMKIQKSHISTDKDINKVLKCIPYKNLNNNLPDSIKTIIKDFHKKKHFQDDYFYLIIDQEKIVGYVGLDFHHEPIPYGEYGFIYCLNLNKNYYTLKNFKIIFSFLQLILKKKKIYNMDISSNSCSIKGETFKKLGFIELTNVNQVKGTIQKKIQYDIVSSHKEEVIDLLAIKDLKNVLSVNRSYPLAYLYDYWLENKGSIELKKFQYNHQTQVYLLEEHKRLEDKTYYYTTVLLGPIDLYDKKVLMEAYHILIKELAINALSNPIIIDIPIEIESVINQYIEYHDSRRICWYRKIISS
ncbi:hypothetical protein [Natronincola ferrireducens]|uniref:Uncharacterized protein n=1 Tax=Natronincola ferrireducens TaxID=393762 RepID=A0A1G9CTZ2_9FIRM|nr:hypothetical protein [Natronincola ferrireducens]SDK55128.1 hypothetical protein SAMN05660472_01555 [Natronincola ferrireducens]